MFSWGYIPGKNDSQKNDFQFVKGLSIIRQGPNEKQIVPEWSERMSQENI